VLSLNSISVAPGNLSLPLNSVQQYTATALYSDNSTQNLGTNATWSPSDTTLASITTSGVVTAVGQGQVTVQSAFGLVTGTATLTVGGPSFVAVGSLNTPRYDHTATLLPSGKVLIVGGQQGDTILASAELYDPTTGAFTPTGSLAQARTQHTATLLQNGMVLVVGGYNFCCGGSVESLSSAELYNPATGTFASAGGRLNYGHFDHTATLLNDGTVLIAGGSYLINGGGGGDSLSELYDPTTGRFTLTSGQLVTPRSSHTATLLNDGTVVVAGGNGASGVLASAEVYNPGTGTFTAVGNLNVPRWAHTATLLNSGKVLIAAGEGSTTSSLNSAEIYDPAIEAFALTGSLTLDRASHTAALLQNGSPLIVGGQGAAGNTGTAELFDTAGQTFTGSGALNRPRGSGHTATLLNDGTVLITGGINVHEEGGAELYIGAGPTYAPPTSLRITPTGVNMLVGGTQQFTVVDSLGHPRSDATWTLDNTSFATITTDGAPTLTALAPGQVTLTASINTVSAQTQVTISSGTSLSPGTSLWSAPSTGGFFHLQLAQAAPIDGAPSLYSTQLSSDGTQTVVQALTSDGQQLWQMSLPALNSNSVPDIAGGLLVTEHQTCNQGQTDPMSIVDLDPVTGQPLWQITAQPTTGGTGPLYCFPEAPQMAIRNDGSIVIAALGNTSGLPELMIVDPTSGAATQISIPPSTYTNPDQSQGMGYSRIWAPIVSSDGSAYVQYQVSTTAYPPKITSATLYLLQIAPDNSETTIQLSSTTSDENLFPGPIIPDGQGGVVATWTVSPSNPPMPANPYQAAHVVNGGVAATYNLPFTRTTFPVPYGKYPTLVLGQNNIIFVTDGSNTDTGPQIAALDLTSGAQQWASPFPTNHTLELVVALEGGGVALKDTGGSPAVQIVRFDASGNINYDNWDATGLSPDFISGTDTWNGSPDGSSVAEIVEPYAAVPVESDWAFVGGTPSHDGSTAAFISNGVPFWGGNYVNGTKPPKCATVATAPKAQLTGDALARYTDKKQKLLTGGFLTSTACAAFFNGTSLAQVFGSLNSSVTNQLAYDGSHSSITMYDAGAWVPEDFAIYDINVYKTTQMSCMLNRGVNAYPNGLGIVAESQVQPPAPNMPATDMYLNTFNYKLLTQAIILHEALHNLTLTNDIQLKGLLGLDVMFGRFTTDDISNKLEAKGCAGAN
jgi:hypothetical protein